MTGREHAQGRITLAVEELERCVERLHRPLPGETIDDSVAVVSSKLALLSNLLDETLNLLDD